MLQYLCKVLLRRLQRNVKTLSCLFSFCGGRGGGGRRRSPLRMQEGMQKVIEVMQKSNKILKQKKNYPIMIIQYEIIKAVTRVTSSKQIISVLEFNLKLLRCCALYCASRFFSVKMMNQNSTKNHINQATSH